MKMREVAKRFGHAMYCHRNLASAQVTQDFLMQQVVQTMARDEQRALMGWLTRHGPFWEDAQQHSPHDYLECRGEVVTDTAVGEAAYCCFRDIQRDLISLSPSSWEFSPVIVSWIRDTDDQHDIEVINHWELRTLETALRAAPEPLASWDQLADVSTTRYANLTFSPDSFAALRGCPFNKGAANRIMVRLNALDRLKICFDESGQRTAEGHRLYQKHFTGQKAWFSDSSETEKHDFEKELTFQHPERAGESLFCSWHGKVKTPQLRIHFSWPVRVTEPLYVVYIGPKLTRR